MIKENERFHRVLYEPCQNKRLLEMIENLWASYPKRIFWEIKGRAEQVVSQHKEILAAVRAQNAEKAEKLVHNNLVLSSEALNRIAVGFEDRPSIS
jgi:DNA-binding GntR family transcriptional regulator